MPKQSAQVKKKGAMAQAKAAADRAVAIAAKHSKRKKGKPDSEDDELAAVLTQRKKKRESDVDEEEEEGSEEEEEDESGGSSSSSLAAKSDRKHKEEELEELENDRAGVEERITVAKQRNATKLTELAKIRNSFPSEVSTLISYIQNFGCCMAEFADVHFVQPALDVHAGPFAPFAQKKVASAMQKYIVPWSIALEGLSYAKRLSLDVVKAMLIAIIDAEHLMPGHPDCAAEARKHSVAFADFAKRVKNAAGMNNVVLSTITLPVVLSAFQSWTDTVPAPLQNGPWPSTVSR